MGISIWQLLIVLVIVLLLFGTKKLKNIGSDLGGAVRGFRSSMKDGTTDETDEEDAAPAKVGKEESTAAPAENQATGEKRDSA